jgi:chromosome partitioning protein
MTEVLAVLALVNQKGGVGKTTSAVTLAAGLATAGFRTLLVDLDAQGNVADALGLEKGPGLYRLLIEDAGRRAVSSGRTDLDVVLGNKRTVEARQILTGRMFREQVLRQALDGLDGYDAVVLDVAPGVDLLQVSALVAATAFLIPVSLSHLAVVGAGDALASVAALKQAGALRAQFLGILPTMWERTTRESHTQLQALVKQFGRMVWPPIPLDVKAREAPAYGQTLWEYAPGTRALVGTDMEGVRRGGYRQVLQRVVREVLNG